MPFIPLRAGLLAAALLPHLAFAASLNLEQALERAAERSEALRSARAAVSSASQGAQAAGQLPDPMLGLSLENLPVTGPDRFSTTRESMTMKRIALSQEWLSQEKRSLRTAAATAMMARETASLAAATAETRLQTALAYVDAFYASAAWKLAAGNEARAREAVQTTRARLASAGASAPDVLVLAAAHGAAADEAAEVRQQAVAAQLTLARWTGIPADDLNPPALGAFATEQDFVQRYPTVLVKQRELELARKEAVVTASNRRPNWTWEVAYGQRSGYSDLATVGVTIPLAVAPAARQDRETSARLALADKAEAELGEAVRAAQAEYRVLASDAGRLQERIGSFETNVLRITRQRTSATTAAYGAGQGTLAMVYESRQAEIEAERKLLLLQRELAKVRVQLQFKPVRPEELQ